MKRSFTPMGLHTILGRIANVARTGANASTIKRANEKNPPILKGYERGASTDGTLLAGFDATDPLPYPDGIDKTGGGTEGG